MTTSRKSPRLLKGGIISPDPGKPLSSVFAFQYNTDGMTRRADARSTDSDDNEDRSEAFCLTGLGPARLGREFAHTAHGGIGQ